MTSDAFVQPLARELTLLEKAQIYRQQNKDEWISRVKKREVRVEESLGIFQKDPFLETYYKRVDEEYLEKKLLREKEKNMPPQIKVKLRCIYKDQKDVSETLDGINNSSQNNNIEDSHDVNESTQTSPDTTASREGPFELHLTIEKGSNLYYWHEVDKRLYNSCKVQCLLYKNKKKKEPKHLKSVHGHISVHGLCRWNHSITVKGCTVEELEKQHLVFQIIGKNDDFHEVIGEAMIGGKNAIICSVDSNLNHDHRGHIQDETSYWQEALENPGKVVKLSLNVHRKYEDYFTGKTVTPLKRSEILVHEHADRWKNRMTLRKHV